MNLYQYLDVNQSNLNGPRKNNSRLPYSVKHGITLYDCNQMYIGCTNHVDALLLIIFNNCMVCNMYRKGRWCRYVVQCVTIEDREGSVFSSILYISGSFSIYTWIIFLLSTHDIETFYCPNKVTGTVLVIYPDNSTNE